MKESLGLVRSREVIDGGNQRSSWVWVRLHQHQSCIEGPSLLMTRGHSIFEDRSVRNIRLHRRDIQEAPCSGYSTFALWIQGERP